MEDKFWLGSRSRGFVKESIEQRRQMGQKINEIRAKLRANHDDLSVRVTSLQERLAGNSGVTLQLLGIDVVDQQNINGKPLNHFWMVSDDYIFDRSDEELREYENCKLAVVNNDDTNSQTVTLQLIRDGERGDPTVATVSGNILSLLPIPPRDAGAAEQVQDNPQVGLRI